MYSTKRTVGRGLLALTLLFSATASAESLTPAPQTTERAPAEKRTLPFPDSVQDELTWIGHYADYARECKTELSMHGEDGLLQSSCQLFGTRTETFLEHYKAVRKVMDEYKWDGPEYSYFFLLDSQEDAAEAFLNDVDTVQATIKQVVFLSDN